MSTKSLAAALGFAVLALPAAGEPEAGRSAPAPQRLSAADFALLLADPVQAGAFHFALPPGSDVLRRELGAAGKGTPFRGALAAP